MAEEKKPKQSELALKTHKSFQEVMELFSEAPEEAYERTVELTHPEIAKAKRNKLAMRQKAKTFANTPIYRTFHATLTNIIQITLVMPKKSVKISDNLIDTLGEAIRWSAAAYEQSETIFKHNSLCEAISLMYTVKVYANSASSVGLIGKSKSEQLSKSLDAVLRQLVAWRGSLIDEGNGDEE